MKSQLHRRAAAASAFAVLDLIAAPASGEGLLDQCVDANTRAQALRRDRKLSEAREQLKRCADVSCPGLVRDDCIQLLDDLERAQPTIVFDVKGADGHDLAEVEVDIDGHPFADRLDGVALAADPGAHTFTFKATGHPPVVQQFVVKEGEKNRRESIFLKGAEPGEANVAQMYPPPPPRVSPAGAVPEGIAVLRTGALIVGAAGVVALGIGGALAVAAKTKGDDADSLCPGTSCSSSQALNMNREARRWGDAATAVVVCGAGALGAAAALLIIARPSAGRSRIGVGFSATTLAVHGTW